MRKDSSLQNILDLEKKLVDRYKTYANEVDSGEMRRMCDSIIAKHNLHIETLEKYAERLG